MIYFAIMSLLLIKKKKIITQQCLGIPNKIAYVVNCKVKAKPSTTTSFSINQS